MITSDRKHLGLLLFVALLAALLGQACVGTTSENMVVQTVVPVAPERTYQLAVNPPKTELNPGEQVILSAIPLGSEQVLPNLQWSMELASGLGETYGFLSSDSGPSVIYTAPDVFPVSVIVTAKRADTGESDQILFNVIGPTSPTISLLLQGGGSPLRENPKAQDVLLAALPFKDLLATAFPGQNVLLAMEMPNRWEPDATNLRYDYDWAKSEASQYFTNKEVMILVPDGDRQLSYLADLMVKDHLEQVGIKAYVKPMPDGDIATMMEAIKVNVPADLSVLALTVQ